MTVEIPDKSYFKIGEVAKIVGVKPYIIRYWESEFPKLRPAKTKSRQRLFRRKDIELLLVIRTLLYDQKFTIQGARQQLKEMAAAGLSHADILGSFDDGVGVATLIIEHSRDQAADEDPETSTAPLASFDADAQGALPLEVPVGRDEARVRLQELEALLTRAEENEAAAREALKAEHAAREQAEARASAAEARAAELQNTTGADLDRLRRENALLRQELDDALARLDALYSQHAALHDAMRPLWQRLANHPGVDARGDALE